VVTNASELVGDVKIGGRLGCSDHALVELVLLREMGITKSIVRTLNFRRANFQLFKKIVRRTPWETVLREGEQNRAGRSLRMYSTERKSSRSPGVRSRAEKGRDRHG